MCESGLKSIKKSIQKYKHSKKAAGSESISEDSAQEETEESLISPAEAIRYAFAEKRILLRFIAFILFIITVLCAVFGFAHSINLSNKRTAKYYSDAGSVCTGIIAKYGTCKNERLDEEYGKDLWRISGLSYARQMDFNGDGEDELLVAYNDSGIYYYEIWGYDGGEFIKYHSDKANTDSSDIALGSWITVYRHRGKYYIGRISDEDSAKIELLALKNKKFKSVSECEYDAKNDIYAVKGKINSLDFETIKLSFLSPDRAEKTVDTVVSNIEEFDTEDIKQIESEKTPDELKADAYYEIIERYNEKYGKAAYNSEESTCFADGLAVVSLIDFNGDSNEELMLIFRRDKKISGEDKKGNYIMETEPEYCMNIYSWNGTAAKEIFEIEGLSSYQHNTDNAVFYILQKDGGKINICSNSYSVSEKSSKVWKASSRISTMNDDGAFETAYLASASSNYGEMTYSIDGKRVYRREFKEKGYEVPYFCNEDSYDTSEFTVTHLQGSVSNSSEIRNVISSTVKTIKEINPNYNAD